MAVRLPPWGRPKLQSGRARSGREAGAARPRCRFVESLSGRTGMSGQDHTPTAITRPCSTRRGCVAAVTPYLSQCGPRLRGGERGVMGAPRSRQLRGPQGASRGSWLATRAAVRSTSGGTSTAGAPHRPYSRRPSRSPPRRHGRSGGGPARAPVRGLQDHHRSRDRGTGRPVPDRRRPVRLEHAAAPLRRARGGRARPAGGGKGPHGHHPRHARRLRPLVDLPRLRPRGACRQRPGRRLRHGPHPGPPVGPPGGVRRGRLRAGVRRRRRHRRARWQASTPRSFPRRRTGWGWSTARSRSPARPTATTS